MSQKRQFMNPYDVPAVPGTEGWEEMYPYYVLFNRDVPSRMESEAGRFWFRAAVHVPDPLYPLDSNLSCSLHYDGMCALANRTLQSPVMRGFDFRVLNGYVYLESVEVEDEVEVAERTRVFDSRLGVILDNWDSHRAETFAVADELVEELKRIEFAQLLELEPDEVIPRLNRHFPGLDLYREYLKMWDILVRMGQQTLKSQLPAKSAYFVFMERVREMFPGIADKSISQMLQGFDSLLYRPVEELQKLAHAAVELGVADAIQGCGSFEETSLALGRGAGGREWLARLEAVRDPWFEMTNSKGWQKQSLAWNDDLDVPLASIRGYLAALQRGEGISRPKDAVLAERERVTAEFRGRLSSQAEREAFDRVLTLTRRLAPAAEDHNLYHTSFFHSLYDRKVRALGQVLAEWEILAEKEDVFLLNRQELDATIWDVFRSWAHSKVPAGKYHWPERLARRKEILERVSEWDPPPALGCVPDKLRSPFAVVNFGLTRGQLDAWLRVEEGGVDRLAGTLGCSGIVEGTARVCRSVRELTELEPGEILVARTTGPPWAPAFLMAGGCVMDSGGMFCHAAIVAREYNLPTVVGTGYATISIRTGDRIRVDGDKGVVEILERKSS